MNRRAIAARLSLIVAFAGLLPCGVLGVVSIDLLRRRVERASQQALQVIADEVAARTSNYLGHQRELLRAVAGVFTDERRLEEVMLDAPSLGRVTLVRQNTPADQLPPKLGSRALLAVTEGKEMVSEPYVAADTTLAMDMCVPARALRGRAVCAQLDLVELWRFVQRIRVGSTGYALAFDSQGTLVASGAGALRPAVVSGGKVPQSTYARGVADGSAAAPTEYKGADGEAVIAGWARLADVSWAIVVEQPTREALRSARDAQWMLAGLLLLALTTSIVVGMKESQRVLRELEIEERWRTAGRIASGIAHDLGHRLRILEQTASLAEAADAAFLPRIRDNLRNELQTLKKFISDFSDLSRDLKSLELIPLELGAFLQSIRLHAAPYVESAGIYLKIRMPESELWVRADRHLLERAMLNLINNATEASARGSTVQISVIPRGAKCGIEVADQGTGIAPQQLPQLFDAFKSTKRTGAHLGMGLPNVKRIVEAHGGEISVQSQPGKGTTFTLLFPECSPASQQAAVSELRETSVRH